jgi:alkylation response protein AidB-like acyl-CoA dehydrogenase
VRPIKQIDSSSEFNEVFFENARCPRQNVVGGENNGWNVAMTTLGFERGASSTTGFRRFARELDLIIKQAQRLGRTSDPLVRQALAHAWSKVKIMEINGYRSLTDALNGTHNAAALGAVNKMFWSEYHRQTMELAISILGMEGQILTGTGGGADDGGEDGPLGRRGSPGYPVSTLQASYFFSVSETIWGGTAEIQRNIVGERVLGLPKEPKAAV